MYFKEVPDGALPDRAALQTLGLITGYKVAIQSGRWPSPLCLPWAIVGGWRLEVGV